MESPIKEFDVEFKNFMVNEISPSITYHGLYYVCAMQKDAESEASVFGRLLYIGKSNEEGGIYGRYLKHSDKDEWKKQLGRGEYLGFFTAEIGCAADLVRVEAALIYAFKPPLNVQHAHMFGYPITKVNISNIWGLKKTKELLGRYLIENRGMQ